MDIAEKFFGIIAAIALGFSVGPIILKKVSSKKEVAETDHTLADKDSISVKTAREVVSLVREAMEDQDKDLKEKVNEISEFKALTKDLERRVKQLEENERVNLIWFADQRAWSDQAYKRLVKVDPDFPAPPQAPWDLRARAIILGNEGTDIHER